MSAPSSYRTAPDQTLTTVPKSVPYIVVNEAAERFSFYGVRSILATFMTIYLMNSVGHLDVMNKNEAQGWFHVFISAVYFTPILGAILADSVVGKYRTILWLSIVYCCGHLALFANTTRLGLAIGLGLIALGAGGIKPCVSANVGDQFGGGNKHLLNLTFNWFYFGINIGYSLSVFLCPIFLNNPNFGPRFAFGLPGILMLIATIVFWSGRRLYVHIPPAGFGFVRECFSKEGLSALGRVSLIFSFFIVFWALWDQSQGGEWILQARDLDRHIFGYEILPEHAQLTAGFFVLSFIPILNYVIYPTINKFFPLTPIRKIGMGFFLTVIPFLVIWCLQVQLDAGSRPNVCWQLIAYATLSAAEVMVYGTGLEFAYTQAPTQLKSAVMALFLFAVSLGNQFTAAVNFAIPFLRSHGLNLDGASYFRFYALLMLVSATAFIFVARRYREKVYMQGEAPVQSSKSPDDLPEQVQA